MKIQRLQCDICTKIFDDCPKIDFNKYRIARNDVEIIIDVCKACSQKLDNLLGEINE